MPPLTIISESDVPGVGWTFTVSVPDEDSDRSITLSFADYNLWSPSGGDPPQAVAGAVMRFLLDRDGEESLKSTFDCSLARRLHADADSVIPGMIQG